MAKQKSRTASSLIAAALVVSGLGWSAPTGARQQQPATRDDPRCTIDLAVAGQMKDVVSNALLRALDVPETSVKPFLLHAEKRYATGPALLKAAAGHFKLEEAVLAAEVERYKHVNCEHEPLVPGAPWDRAKRPDDGMPVSVFAKDVTLHVVLHELGHALIREFDIPILGNEETAADAFATYYLTTYLPDRAVDVLMARTRSLMIEAAAATEVDWSGEHDHDARRAYQIAALAIAADRLKYQEVAAQVGMSEEDIGDARDYGAEIRRSWRRVLGPLLMPDGTASSEARVLYDSDDEFINGLCADGLASEIESAARRFDWHSQVTVHFVEGDGGAAWSRSGRTVTVHSGYVRRFVEQGDRGLTGSK
jgi:hypothetical protein